MVTETIARGAAVSISHLHHAFTLGKQTVPVLENISLQLRPGESVALLGPSGCGKSTLLRLLAGLEAPQSGQMQIDGAALGAPGPERILVFQDPTLYPWLTVRQNVLEGLITARGVDRAEAEKITDEVLEKVGMLHRSDFYPDQLSGGQQQRVLLARALCAAGRLLLMDEPFTGLDPTVTNELYDVVDKLNHEQGVTVIMVTHDVPEALRHASRILHLGAEHFDGTAEEYRQSPLYRRLMGGDLNA